MEKRFIEIDETKMDLMNRAIEKINDDNENAALFMVKVAAILEDIWNDEVFSRAEAEFKEGVIRA